MAQRAKDNPKIRFAWNSVITGIHGGGKVTGVSLKDTVTGEPANGQSPASSSQSVTSPRTELLTGQVDLDAEGYITVDSPTTVTNLP